ncbi:MAG: D-alanyl-D-alanine carboxypeptidase family protein [Alphaproteobacteria bacterium]|nr:D-alanyl-D-alanine carboxypeptidase family protein [Alphaproteobacteria bacterium]
MRLRGLGVALCVFLLAFAAPVSVIDAHAKSNATSSATSSGKSTKAKAKSSSKKKTSSTKKRLKKRYGARPSAPSADKFAAVVVDASTGQVLYEKNAGDLRYPASLTKMMTLYLTFDALKRGKLRLNQKLPVSAKAAGQPQTNINLSEGDWLTVEEAIEALVVRSGNDASVVLAEKLGGTVWSFAQMMTQKARELGMRDTVFRNPNGLPDNGQYTNAFDMARLGIALRRDFPEYYPYFKTERFDFRGVTYTTHNRVMLRYNGADGIKTGYIRASGFNLVTSVKKSGYNIVAVIMGGPSGTVRDDMMINMLDRTFAELASKRQSSMAQTSHNLNLAQARAF